MVLRNFFVIVLVAGCILCSGGSSFAGWQAVQPAPENTPEASPFSLEEPSAGKPVQNAGASESPFSLENDSTASPPGAPPPTVPQTVKDSPFALPSTTGPETEPAQNTTDSPFALPDTRSRETQGGFQPDPGSAKQPQENSSAKELLAEGLRLAKTGKLEEARVALAMSAQKDPENVVTLNNLGLVLRKLERMDDALTAYQYALQVDETYPLTYKNIGVLLEKRGEKELAIKAYREYSRLAPSAGDAANVAARADWLEQNK